MIGKYSFICTFNRLIALSKYALIIIAINSFSTTYAISDSQTVDPKLRQLLTEAINSSESFDDRFHAEVWLLDMSNRLKRFVKDEQTRLDMLKQIHLEASRAGLQPELVLAVIEIESHFDSYAISKAGAQGMMQVMPFWLDEIGRPEDNLIVMKTNLRMGCTILKYYMDMENGDLHEALARYNGSKGSRVYSNKVLDALRKHWYKS
jgi:soluble lytic murein transglycosylase-like protein